MPKIKLLNHGGYGNLDENNFSDVVFPVEVEAVYHPEQGIFVEHYRVDCSELARIGVTGRVAGGNPPGRAGGWSFTLDEVEVVGA